MSTLPDQPSNTPERREAKIPLIWSHDYTKKIGRVRLDSRDHVNFELTYDINQIIAGLILSGDLRELTLGYAAARAAVEERPPSHMVEHARRELKLLGEDEVTIEWYLSVIQAYSDFGHSGGSHSATLPVLMRLLEQKNLRPLTSNPDEWVHHTADTWPPAGIWQNKRNSEAFSMDDGKTYWLVSEAVNAQGIRPVHETVSKEG